MFRVTRREASYKTQLGDLPSAALLALAARVLRRLMKLVDEEQKDDPRGAGASNYQAAMERAARIAEEVSGSHAETTTGELAAIEVELIEVYRASRAKNDDGLGHVAIVAYLVAAATRVFHAETFLLLSNRLELTICVAERAAMCFGDGNTGRDFIKDVEHDIAELRSTNSVA